MSFRLEKGIRLIWSGTLSISIDNNLNTHWPLAALVNQGTSKAFYLPSESATHCARFYAAYRMPFHANQVVIHDGQFIDVGHDLNVNNFTNTRKCRWFIRMIIS